MFSLNELENSITNALSKLEYGISYDLDSYEETDGYRVVVTFYYDNFNDDVPNDWDCDLEDNLKDVVGEYGGSYFWEDNTLVYTVPLT